MQLFAAERPPALDRPTPLDAASSGYGGCDLVVVVKDPLSSSPDNFNLMAGITRGSLLYVLVKACEPVADDLVFQLVAIQDQTTLLAPAGAAWARPVTLSGDAGLVPLDTTVFGDADEFQIALIPLSDSTAEAFDNSEFSQGIRLLNPGEALASPTP